MCCARRIHTYIQRLHDGTKNKLQSVSFRFAFVLFFFCRFYCRQTDRQSRISKTCCFFSYFSAVFTADRQADRQSWISKRCWFFFRIFLSFLLQTGGQSRISKTCMYVPSTVLTTSKVKKKQKKASRARVFWKDPCPYGMYDMIPSDLSENPCTTWGVVESSGTHL